MKTLLALVLAVLALLAPAAAFAQTGPLIIDTNRPDRSPPVAAPAPTPPPGAGRVEAAQAASTPSFVLRRVEIQGSTLSAAQFASVYRGRIGRPVSSADLNAMADAVGAVYAQSQIALYTVILPRQTFADGVVRLRVIEGFVSQVELSGHPKGMSLVRQYGERLKAEHPLRRRTLDRYLSLIRDIPGLKIDVQLLQGAQPGAVRLVLKPTTRRVEFGVSVNNRGSDYLGRTQIQTQATVNSLLRQGDSTTLIFAFPTEIKRFQYIAVSHVEPLGTTGATLSLNLGHLITKPKISGMTLSGSATTAGLQLAYPVMRGSKDNLFVTGGIDGLDSENALFGRRFASEKTRALRVAASFSRASATRATSVSVTLSQGLDGLGAKVGNKAYAVADYRKANVQASYNQAIDKKWVVRIAAAAQISGDRLPGSEQFSIGGAQFGRAFAASEAIGDSGYGASAELAYRPSRGVPKILAGSEVYAFTDGASAQSANRTGYKTQNHSLASAGVGVRLAVASKGVLELEAAKAIDESGIGSGRDRPWRLMLNFRSVF